MYLFEIRDTYPSIMPLSYEIKEREFVLGRHKYVLFVPKNLMRL
jgi:hypothetical protein